MKVPVYRAIGVSAVAAVLQFGLAGCSRDDSREFSHYKDSPQAGPLSLRQEGPVRAEKPRSLASRRSAATANVPAMDSATNRLNGLQAGIGFGSLSLEDAQERKDVAVLTAAVLGNAAAVLDAVSQTVSQTAANARKVTAIPATPGGVKPNQKLPLVRPRKIKLLVKDRKFRVVGPESAIRVNYDDINLLKVLNMDPVTLDAPKRMPKWLKDLNGKRIRIRGFMRPSFSQTGLESFMMGRDNKACCFPGVAKVYDLFPVKMRDGVTTDFILNRPFDVVGVFHIKLWILDGKLERIYQIEDAVVIQ